MYHHHSQQQGPQPFSNGSRLPHQPPPNQHQNRSSTDISPQAIGFQFPRPTQLPDELESALSIRGARDMDHRLIDHMNQPNQHQNQGPGAGISQHDHYSANTVTLASDQPAHQQGVDWSSYQPPTKLFANAPPGHQSHRNQGSQRHQGLQQQPQSSHTGANTPSWTAPVSDSPSSLARHLLGSAGGGVDGQSLYTPESAGSILASFGLSNEDLEVLSHYPDDQLTPDTLPFILRDIQINKSGIQKTVTSSSSTSFSRNIRDIPLSTSHSSSLARSQSPEVPSLLTVTQTAGKVIDYGHASRANDESSTRETFKREPLSSERTVKMYPSSSLAAKVDKTERRQVHLEHTETSKHGDQDYRRTSSDHCKSTQSPAREFSAKARNLDRDYRRDRPKPRPSSETRSEDSSIQSPSSSDSKPIGSSKKIPAPTMITDFSAVSPKVYPHTCSLCHTQCDQEKDWVEHINTVSHTAACRDLRNKYPAWKPNLPRSGRYGSRALWEPKDGSPSYSISRSLSCSPPSSPPYSKHREVPRRPHGRPYSPHRHPRHHPYTEHRAGFRYSGPHSPSHMHQTTSSHIRDQRSEKRVRESSGSSHRSGVKHAYDAARYSTESNRDPSSKHGPSQSYTRAVKGVTKPGPKSVKSPPVKKKKKMMTQSSQDLSIANRLVYLTGIPNDASEQEVTEMVGSFGKINNVILMPSSEEEGEKNEGQKASVCMVKAEDAKALANSTHLSIREQHITTSLAKKPEGEHSSDANSSKPAPVQNKRGASEESGGEADQKTEENGMVLITGLPESGWSESDIVTLVQSFGTPSDIIMATQIGKVLVSVPDIETAQEMVKVYTFTPVKIKDSEVKMIHMRQRIGLNTPVALYNLLVGSMDPLEGLPPVTWSSLLVISNVPNTPSAPSEVQKLVRRFGTVIKTLVLNNMVICEMATAAMALSVYKRFQTFPCVIQNNPLFFSRKPDPKAQAKVILAYTDSSEDAPTNGTGSQKASAVKEETAHEEESKCHLEMEKNADGKNEKMKSIERPADKDKMLAENGSDDGNVNKDEATDDISSVSKPEADEDTNMKETSPVKTGDTSEETEGIRESETGNETNPCSFEGKAVVPEVTSQMVNALIVECRTSFGSQPDNTAASACQQQETQMETEQNREASEQTKAQDKSHTEDEAKKQERERKERQARKEKDRREKERRAWEKEERTRREREREERVRRERERREEERRERERRDRKRAYGEGFPGSKSSFSSQGYKQTSWREEEYNSSKADTKMEDDNSDFPFNMGDFVTLDEVGDVNELPCSPTPAVSMETTEGDMPTSVAPHTAEDTHMEVTTETMSHTTESQVKPSEHDLESEPAAETSDSLVLITAAPPSSEQPCPSHTHEPPCQAQASETTTETQLASALDSTTEYPLVIAPTVSSNAPEAAPHSHSPGAALVTAASKEEEKRLGTHSQAAEEEEEAVSDKAEEQEKVQDEEDKDTEAHAAETGKHEVCEDQTNIGDKRENELKTETALSTDYFLLPFDPSRPVGMEFLVPKTGFFCKVCNRFFSGNKEAEINHCKTVKHYDNLQKYFETTKMTTKPDTRASD